MTIAERTVGIGLPEKPRFTDKQLDVLQRLVSGEDMVSVAKDFEIRYLRRAKREEIEKVIFDRLGFKGVHTIYQAIASVVDQDLLDLSTLPEKINYPLNDRQESILGARIAGLTDYEIAEDLGTKVERVREQSSNITSRLLGPEDASPYRAVAVGFLYLKKKYPSEKPGLN